MALKNFFRQILFAAFLIGVAFTGNAQQTDELLTILQTELDRNMQVFKGKDDPVYLMSYRVDEVQSYRIGSTLGNIDAVDSSLQRVLTIQVRLGNYELDNFHELRDDASNYFSYRRRVLLPLDNVPEAITQLLWRETDEAYREALSRYEKVKANVAVKVEADDKSPDYSSAPVNKYFEPALKIPVNIAEWTKRATNYSSLFTEEPQIINGDVTLYFQFERKYFVNSEGTSIVQNQNYCRLFISGETQADDGMELPLFKSYFAHTPSELPLDNILIRDTKEMIAKLIALRTAPVVDTYTGPALLTNEAAGVFFHEIFGHRVEGQRMKSESDGQTFKKKLNEEVLNPAISVVFDPNIKDYQGIPLNGSYKYDDEGVRGERVMVVDQGILRNFLMTRTPIDSFPRSNGHARAQAGSQPVSRQSNLIVETSKPYTDAQLREMLINEAKTQGKEYGYIFATVQGGFTMTGRYIPNSFNVTPVEVYRIYVDGRLDEIVRGVDLVGTPLSMFSQIEAAGDTPGNFAGTCGAESGNIPAACCSPALFVKRIEMQKKSKAQNRPPITERTFDPSKKDDVSFEKVAFQAMQDEMDRNLNQLKIEGLKSPYFIGYLITDAKLMVAESSLGAIKYSAEKPYRDQETKVLVGSNKRNNLNFIDENSLFGSWQNFTINMPENNNYNGIRNSLWLSTDFEYKTAAESIEAKNAAITQQNLPQTELDLPDFSTINATQQIKDVVHEKLELEKLENISVQLSALLKNYPNFTNSGASLYAYQAKALYLNSEGIKYNQPFSLIALRVFAETQADDGETLMNHLTLYFTKYEDIPSLDQLKKQITEMADLLEKLRVAPVVDESFSGPVMFTGEAVGEIVSQAFIENNNGLLAGRKNIISNPNFMRSYGAYLPKENTVENMKGKKVISRDLTLRSIAGKEEFNDMPLIGAYQIDAEGVTPAQELVLIDEGVLQNLLTDRIPTAKFQNSNGHKRLAISGKQLTTSLAPGVIEMTGKTKMSYEKMKKRLIAMAKEEDYEYAYMVTKMLSSNNNYPGSSKYQTSEGYYRPICIVRINVKDGTETMMRMSKVSALTMKSFKQVVAISNQQQVYNTLLKGKAGRNIWSSSDFNISGVPVSFIVPDAILFQELEVEKDQNVLLKKKSDVKNPLQQ